MSELRTTTSLEKESLEAHVDLCALRYAALDSRLTNVENTLRDIHLDIKNGQQSMTKVLIGTAGTVIAGLLSTIVVILLS
jgi:1,4-dihydroxy-2-naphthoate octaprenyltransferase